MDSASSGRKVVLRCTDGAAISVSHAVASQMQHIKHQIINDHDPCIIKLPNVDSDVFAKLIPYCERHAVAHDPYLKAFDDEFLNKHRAHLSEVLLGAYRLGIMSLFDLMCESVADMIKGKSSPEEIRKMFNIKSDITPEEEERIRQHYSWAFN